ncbi:MAG: anti-sigma factor [Bryobacteraceae bacterium]
MERSEKRGSGWTLFWLGVATLCFSATMYFFGRERQYVGETLELRRQLGRQEVELTRQREALTILKSPGTVAARADSAAMTGSVWVNPAHGVLLTASRVKPAPPRQAYQMWAVTRDGRRHPAGQFQPDSEGAVAHIDLGPVGDVAAIEVTLEAQGAVAQSVAPPVLAIPLPGAH